jgi:spoIIIJ-associated protein
MYGVYMDTAQLTQLVSDLLAALGASPDSIAVTSGHRTIVAISVTEPDILIGPGGEHLRALNTIAHRLVENKHGEEATHFLIDINGYHEAQLEKVREAARVLAQRARLFKHEVEMEPMSSYERLVVHELFADDAEIQTESAGEGKFRHVVIKPK